MTMPHKLANIDAGQILPATDPSIAKYQDLLGQVKVKFPSAGEEKIGDLAVKSKELLQNKGVSLSVAEVLEGLKRSAPDNSPVSIEEVAAALVTTTGRR